ncbi:putative NADH dehydrogenase II [Streptomyces lincolnensis]|uniref:Putative NADH dehydrogenase II n=1 Tax=Streptomyces lincolnensis TaxID=1915 RepID=A0A1B1M194_STRLN|nr:FAD-dependent oxidoreductase [Streptomyces lincolnensis]ANS62405.1 putative NADH dehydrogenase II [Streptomyces lincolnensis]AXG51330.1 putative NADH dehydrogenase II [Streptomyces lincolnensis]QMV04400.1 FAD-dependent oxidoreductase [Streptomyces lincolnensis]QMV11924.1 FAD-dependent oxidoreductase [Streptomyces lincolnensis]
MNNGHHIVVLGAGYTGMFSAIRLAHRTRRTGVKITLVNPSSRFVERLRMHQIAAGQELADHQIPDLLAGTGVTFVQGTATAIDPEARQITVDGAETLGYDTLVYALGSSTDTGKVPGADTQAFTLDNPQTAGRFAARLSEVASSGGTVTVCGGGLTGIEAATEIAESHPGLDVTLISLDEPGGMMGAKARAYLYGALDRLGITLETGARITKVLPDAVELADGRLVHSDACLWTTGVKVSPLAADAGIATDDRGLILVDATLRSVSHPEIHAIGDAAAVRLAWGQIHGTCQSGLPTAQYTADTIARLVRGKAVKPFRFGYFHQPVSLGRRDAVIQFTKADETPRRMHLTGRSAAAYKEMVSGSPLTTYRFSKRMNVTTIVSKGGRATRKPTA